MNQLQEVEFRLLQEFIHICERLDLRYYLVCGSALGAVKYGGFIPWDDDIDVALLRDDYEIFCQQAQALLPSHLFLQNYRTEPTFPAIYSKLRDSSTTCIEASVSEIYMNHGISMDIFPLDGYPSDALDIRILELKKRVFTRLLSIPCIRPEHWKERIIKPLRLIGAGQNSAQIAKRYTKCISSWPTKGSYILANHGNWQGKLEYHTKSVYGDGCLSNFEGLAVRIPSDYEKYLQQKYGDYHQDPPLAKQKSHHKYLLLDLNCPYTHYMSLPQNEVERNKK